MDGPNFKIERIYFLMSDLGLHISVAPICGPLVGIHASRTCGKHMGRRECRSDDKLAIGPLRGQGVPANIPCARI